ncbi:Rv2175c family DNA-binding protein [Ruania zhangjianzhongii]|uniref:Rv2175c family DNA-binding protein n=1 Tax=Ruania zhangjianzhongii TaxID=2603206 RepID=UPI0011C84495|nr:Rv2175c family DNA-binding protein [Ruania zhangjianzhongii]
MVDEQNWLSLPEVAEATDLQLRTVRGYLRDRVLVATRRGENNALAVPEGFLVPGEETGTLIVLPSLRGTITMLADSGYGDDEIVDWLLRENDELGATPLANLRDGRTHAVRRAAQALAF